MSVQNQFICENAPPPHRCSSTHTSAKSCCARAECERSLYGLIDSDPIVLVPSSWCLSRSYSPYSVNAFASIGFWTSSIALWCSDLPFLNIAPPKTTKRSPHACPCASTRAAGGQRSAVIGVFAFICS